MKKSIIAAALAVLLLNGCGGPDKTPEAVKGVAVEILTSLQNYDNDKVKVRISSDLADKLSKNLVYLTNTKLDKTKVEISDVIIVGEDTAKAKIKVVSFNDPVAKGMEKNWPLTVWVFKVIDGDWKIVAIEEEQQKGV